MSGDNARWVDPAPTGGPHVSPDGIVQQGVTEVDVESLASAVDWLQGLKSYVEDHLVPDAAKMVITKDDADLWFGGLDSASQVSGLHSSYVGSVIDSYRAVAKSLDAARQATADIVKNYQDVEHNNAVTAQNIDSAFATAGSGGSSSGGSPPADGPTQADTTPAGTTTTATTVRAGAPTEGSWS